MPDRPPFPIPEDLTPDTFCLCLRIPNDPIWKTVIAGLLFQPAEWFNWQRDEDRSGKELAQYWRTLYNQIDWSTMSCCCPDDDIPLSRYTPDGHYQISTDDGETWEDSPTEDPRRPVTQFPPFVPPDTLEEKCTYADSIVNVIKTQMVELLDDAGNWQSIINVVVSAFVAVFGVLAPTVVGALIVAILGGIAVAIIGVSIPAFKAAMTDDVYNRLRCNLRDHIGDDGLFDQTGVDAVYSQIGTDETGLTALFLQGVVAAAGWQGLTNMARSGYGAADADCSDCDDCELVVAPPGTGTCTYLEPCKYRLTSFVDGGQHSIYAWFNNESGVFDVNACAIVTQIDLISGTFDATAYNECVTGTLHNPALVTGHCMSQLYVYGSSAFTIDVTVTPC